MGTCRIVGYGVPLHAVHFILNVEVFSNVCYRRLTQNITLQFDPLIVKAFGKLLESGRLVKLLRDKRRELDADSFLGIT